MESEIMERGKLRLDCYKKVNSGTSGRSRRAVNSLSGVHLTLSYLLPTAVTLREGLGEGTQKCGSWSDIKKNRVFGLSKI